MSGKFEVQIDQMKIRKDQTEAILAMINSAGEEFPCLACPSKDDCETFRWFIKWFEEKHIK